MYQPILVYADIDESTEISHVGDNALERHSLFEVRDFFDTLFEVCRFEFRPRISTRLFELGKNVGHSRQTETLVDKGLRIERFQIARIANQIVHRFFSRRADFFDNRVGFGVHG